MKRIGSFLIWMLISMLGAAGFSLIALNSGEKINSIWLLTAAVCTYAVAYRFYSRFLARKVFQLDDNRKTPSEIHNDGKDFVPTSKWVLFGHHFAAIAGAGPLVGPILAAQMGYLPGTLWIIIGVVLGGAVQDFIILFGSMRRNGKSLGEIAREEIGPIGGFTALIAVLSIMIILLAVLALVVVKALADSPWGMFTIVMTIPIALFMGVYMRYVRPGKVLEASLIGFGLLLLSLVLGQYVSVHPTLAPLFTLKGETIAWLLIIYGFIASVIPVWLLLAPRDYLSTFLKIGTIFALALGIIWVAPELQMPALTKFIDGTGPVFAGNLFPFVFITIACGAISGFHSLVSSGTTPKMIARESHAQAIGYGGMITESFVAIMALIAACLLTPGVYFAINSPAAVIGVDVNSAATAVSNFGFTVTPEELATTAKDIGENSILSRTGGAPTLAIGMAHIFSSVLGGKAMMAFWYHFAILFEAVFILTTIDAGTRVGRFVLQDLIGNFVPRWKRTDYLPANILASALIVAGWGYFLYQGVIDPLGGINTLWPLFGIANQMLAVIALVVGTTILFKMGKAVYTWVTLIPFTFLTIATMTAAYAKLFDPSPKIGFLSAAEKYQTALNAGQLLAPAKTVDQMKQIILNNQIDAWVTGLFMVLVILIILDAVRVWYKIMFTNKQLPLRESPYVSHSHSIRG
ncbi:carbon starvation CstA family protein [Thermoactinomyces sp. DSM 45892]|uniref:carbon starvation CstA family protein n=1 Tax=Thermoactinomyces sp. DSM 45892 TaxID=1882753 RepID=UPI00089779E5|nr:carbon starvation CstA family protein [Thermoactinomyces sp. DSM 45892]SDY15463.1 carbon starvation protein [Thermoactinomyces sp. DSM 45892]